MWYDVQGAAIGKRESSWILKAIVFDFDGTVVDTESAVYTAWRELYESHGGKLPLEQWVEVVGAPGQLFDPYEELESQIGTSLDRRALEPQRRSRELELVAAERPRPGVLELLEASRARGIKIGLATNSRSNWAEMHLEALGIRHYFEVVATADDVEVGKPDPAMYALAAERLGVRPEDALAIEDSPSGALGAVRAGLVCLVVPSPLTRQLEFRMAHAVWESLAGADVDDLVALWRSVRTSSY